MQHIDSHGIADRPELGPEPTLHDRVRVSDSDLGVWTELHPGTSVRTSEVGAYSYLMRRVQLDFTTLGRFCSVASDVRIGPVNHPMNRPTTHHFTYRAGQYGLGDPDEAVFEWRRGQAVEVGHDVWVGHGATVLPDVEIGNGAVVAAGAVVTDDVAPYAVVAGVPAERVGWRFPPDVAAAVEATTWWEWDHDTIRERLPAFRDLGRFLTEYAPADTPAPDPEDVGAAPGFGESGEP
jgi:phosphonate metabolism protein (transferase hexapeptide repeat family)